MQTGFIQEYLSLHFSGQQDYGIPFYAIEALSAADFDADPAIELRLDASGTIAGFRTVLVTIRQPGTYYIRYRRDAPRPLMRLTLLAASAPQPVAPPLPEPAPVATQFTIERVQYAAGNLLLDVRCQPLSANTIVEVRGAVSKRLVWDQKKTSQQLRLPFVLRGGLQQVEVWVGDAQFSGAVFDPLQFPSRVVKIDPRTFKLDRACGLELTIRGSRTTLTLAPKETRFTVEESDVFRFSVQGYELFEQYIEVAGLTPLLTLATQPLRLVLDSVPKQDVVVWLDGQSGSFRIPAGSTSALLPPLWERGIRCIRIQRVENARFTQPEWVVQV